MSQNTHASRRSVLQLLGISLGASIAGCVGEVPIGGSDDLLGDVPEASGVGYLRVEDLLTDSGIQKLGDAYFGQLAENSYYEGPEDYEEAIDEFRDQIDLDPDTVTDLFAFGDYDQPQQTTPEYAAAIVSAEFDIEDLIDAFENQGTELEEDDYKGTVVYKSESENALYVGALSATKYAIGTEEAVESVIDVTEGDEESLSGDVHAAFTALRSGFIRVAGMVPAEQIPDEYEEFANVNAISGALYRDEDLLGGQVALSADDENDAEDIESAISDLRSNIRDETGSQTARDELSKVELSRDGATVVITYERTINELVDIIESNGDTSTFAMALANDADGELLPSATVPIRAFRHQIAKFRQVPLILR